VTPLSFLWGSETDHLALEFDFNTHELMLDQAVAKAKGISLGEWVRIMLARV